jgi:hypothetical protein
VGEGTILSRRPSGGERTRTALTVSPFLSYFVFFFSFVQTEKSTLIFSGVASVCFCFFAAATGKTEQIGVEG